MMKITDFLIAHEVNGQEQKLPALLFYSVAMGIAVLWSFLFYPGFFTADSFDQWNQAQLGMYNSWHPIIMAVIWRYTSYLLGEGSFFVLNQLLYWLAFAMLIDVCWGRHIKYLILGFFPPTFIMSFDVWKDVPFYSSMMISVSLLIFFINKGNKHYLILCGFFLVYASLLRINGLIPSFIIVFLASVFISKQKKLLLAVLISFIFILTVKTANTVLLKYYDATESRPIPTLLLWDIAGISHFSQQNIQLPEMIPVVNKDKAVNWLNNYTPIGCSLCWNSGIVCQTESPQKDVELMKVWGNLVMQEPLAYLKHRVSVSKWLFGLEKHLSYPYDNYQWNDVYGRDYNVGQVGQTGKFVFDQMSKIFRYLERFHLFHPYLWLLLQILIILFVAMKYFSKNNITLKLQLVFLISVSGLANAVSLIFIAVAADYRYIIWSILSGFISVCILFSKNFGVTTPNSRNGFSDNKKLNTIN